LSTNRDAERIRLHLEHPRSPIHGLPGASGKNSDGWIRPHPWSQAAVSIELVHRLAGCSDGHPQDVVTYGRNRECEDGWACNLGCERMGGGQKKLEEHACAARPDTLQEAPSGKSPRHLSPPSRDRERFTRRGILCQGALPMRASGNVYLTFHTAKDYKDSARAFSLLRCTEKANEVSLFFHPNKPACRGPRILRKTRLGSG
jgi:hypothetical protein